MKKDFLIPIKIVGIEHIIIPMKSLLQIIQDCVLTQLEKSDSNAHNLPYSITTIDCFSEQYFCMERPILGCLAQPICDYLAQPIRDCLTAQKPSFYLSFAIDKRSVQLKCCEIVATDCHTMRQVRQPLYPYREDVIDKYANKYANKDHDVQDEDNNLSPREAILKLPSTIPSLINNYWFRNTVFLNRYIVITDYNGLRVLSSMLNTIYCAKLTHHEINDKDVYGYQAYSIPLITSMMNVFVLKTWIVKDKPAYDSDSESQYDDEALTDESDAKSDDDYVHADKALADESTDDFVHVNEEAPPPMLFLEPTTCLKDNPISDSFILIIGDTAFELTIDGLVSVCVVLTTVVLACVILYSPIALKNS